MGVQQHPGGPGRSSGSTVYRRMRADYFQQLDVDEPGTPQPCCRRLCRAPHVPRIEAWRTDRWYADQAPKFTADAVELRLNRRPGRPWAKINRQMLAFPRWTRTVSARSACHHEDLADAGRAVAQEWGRPFRAYSRCSAHERTGTAIRQQSRPHGQQSAILPMSLVSPTRKHNTEISDLYQCCQAREATLARQRQHLSPTARMSTVTHTGHSGLTEGKRPVSYQIDDHA